MKMLIQTTWRIKVTMGRQTEANGTKLEDKQGQRTPKKSNSHFQWLEDREEQQLYPNYLHKLLQLLLVVDVHIIVKPPFSPLGVSLTATRSSGSSTAADWERRTTEAKRMRGNDSDTTTTLTSSCGTRRRPDGGRVIATTEPRKRGIITAFLTAPTLETNWQKMTGRIWVTGKSASETRWARRWAWDEWRWRRTWLLVRYSLFISYCFIMKYLHISVVFCIHIIIFISM